MRRKIFLRIQNDSSKTINIPIVSISADVGIYKDILTIRKKFIDHVTKMILFFTYLKKRD